MMTLNLQRVHDDNFSLLHAAWGDSREFATATGLAYATVLTHTHTERSLLPATCRSIEAALGLPAYWMDQERTSLDERARRAVPNGDVTLRASGPVLSARRIANLIWLAGPMRGGRADLCRKAGREQAQFPNPRSTVLGPRAAARWEVDLGLPYGWLDRAHDHRSPMPEAFINRIGRVMQQVARATPVAPTPAVPQRAPAPAQAPNPARAETTWDKVHREATQTGAATVAVGTAPTAKPNEPQALADLSPVVRALVEKVISASSAGRLTEAKAVRLLSEVVALETE